MTSAASPAASSTTPVERPGTQRGIRVDSFLEGVALLAVVSVAPRVIGFARGLLFCRWLSPEELGRWDLANGFLLLAAPLAVLGLPGSFGRYVEKYRQRGQLRSFLRRTTGATVVLAVTGMLVVFSASDSMAALVFGDRHSGGLIRLLACGLIATIGFNFLVSLFSALRCMRVVTAMQLIHSVAFAGIGLVLVCCWAPGAESVAIATALAATIASIAAGHSLWRAWQVTPPDTTDLTQQSLWVKLLPFALWIWMTNLLANLFVIADRYMIVHFSSYGAETAAIEIGNYHSSRIVPALLVSVSVMLSTVMTPHLSHDWEQGRREAVSARINLVIKIWSLILMAGATCVLAISPLIYEYVFDGKYDGGLRIQPWTLLCAIWFSLCLIVQTYLWCAERASLVSFTYAVGLVLNICLNSVLLPRFGLLGAVIATTVSTGIALAVVSYFNRKSGMQLAAGSCAGLLLPVCLCLGPVWAAATLVGFCAAIPLGNWFFDSNEKRLIVDGIKECLQRLRFAG